MSPFVHRLTLSFYYIVILFSIGFLTYYGRNYYGLSIEDRYFTASGEVNELDVLLKPSGFIGHGLGVVGSVLIVIGVFGYMARKHIKMFSRIGVLKYWLEFHIFLCTLGPVFVLFHTSFKFGGLVAVGFWSMVIVWSSGIIGRYIYLQIPHSIEGRALSLQEVKDIKEELDAELMTKYGIDFSAINTSKSAGLELKLVEKNISGKDYRQVKRLIRNQKRISRRIKRLDMMQNLFRYWHVAHLPFALIMLVIMVIHVGVSLFFGYKWIF